MLNMITIYCEYQKFFHTNNLAASDRITFVAKLCLCMLAQATFVVKTKQKYKNNIKNILQKQYTNQSESKKPAAYTI